MKNYRVKPHEIFADEIVGTWEPPIIPGKTPQNKAIFVKSNDKEGTPTVKKKKSPIVWVGESGMHYRHSKELNLKGIEVGDFISEKVNYFEGPIGHEGETQRRLIKRDILIKHYQYR